MTGEFKDADTCQPQARTAVGSQNSQIDEAKLDELDEILSAERLKAMLTSYLSHARQQLAQMESLTANQNYAALAAVAHDLKGISGTFGVVRVQHLAEELERACRLDDGAEVSRILGDIRAASRIASIAIAARMDARELAISLTAG